MVRLWNRYGILVGDTQGNVLRAIVWALFATFFALFGIFLAANQRLGAYATLINAYFVLIPGIGALYALAQLRRHKRRWNPRKQDTGVSTLAGSWRAYLEDSPFALAVFGMAVGLLLWAISNVYWALLTVFVTANPLTAPSMAMGTEAVSIMLECGALITAVAFCRMDGQSARRILKSHRLPILVIAAGNLALAAAIALFMRHGCVCAEGDPVAFIISLTYGAVDGLVLAAIIIVPRALQEPEPLWRRSLLGEGGVLALGWLIFIVADQIFELGLSAPKDSPFAYYTGSIYDLLLMAGVVIMIHGLTRLVYRGLTQHPPLRVLTAGQKELARLLVQGFTNNAIALQLKRSISTVEREITELYRVTGFDFSSIYAKRNDFIAHYRPQVRELESERSYIP